MSGCKGQSDKSSSKVSPGSKGTPVDTGKYALLSITTPVEIYNFSYDDEGRLINKVIGQAFPSRESYTYDKSGNILSSIFEEWDPDGRKWTLRSRNSFSYDSEGNKITEVQEFGMSSRTFAIREKARGFYDTTGTLPHDHVESFRVYSARSISFGYDLSGKLISMVTKDWGEHSDFPSGDASYYTNENGKRKIAGTNKYLGDKSWTNRTRNTYSYDDKGNKSSTINEYWSDNKWEESSKDLFAYDKNGRILSETSLYKTNGKFENSRRTTFTYDQSGNQLARLTQNWENNRWVNSTKIENTYDKNGNKLTETAQNWLDNKWAIYAKLAYSYDKDGNCISGKCNILDMYRAVDNSFSVMYNLNKSSFDLITPDNFVAKYKFIK
ncbi:MAG: hypothetical protein AMXMBFR49_13520 [Chlorobiota bacterium]